MRDKNTKVKVRSLDGDTDYFNIVAGVLQGNTLAPYLFINCLDYVLRTSIDLMKENGFKFVKERTSRYPAQTIMDADSTNNTVLLANTPAQAETLLHSLKWAAGGISLHVNIDKTEYIWAPLVVYQLASWTRKPTRVSSSLIGCPIHLALCHIEAKSFVNY